MFGYYEGTAVMSFLYAVIGMLYVIIGGQIQAGWILGFYGSAGKGVIE